LIQVKPSPPKLSLLVQRVEINRCTNAAQQPESFLAAA
jgi:hypothetical protein